MVNLFKNRAWSGTSEAVENDDIELRPPVNLGNDYDPREFSGHDEGSETKGRTDTDTGRVSCTEGRPL